jgi:leucine efflux protein
MISVDWVGFCLASVAVVLAPGPGSVFVAKTAATARARAGLMAMLGIMAGDACLIFLSLLGVSALFLARPSLFHVIRLAGAGYLIFLGIQSIFARPKKESHTPGGHALPFRRAVAITLLNPKAVFFFMTFFPVFIKSAEDGLFVPYATMTLVFMTISATYLTFLIHVSSKLALAFQENRTLQSVARKLCGCVFIAFGLKVATASR